MGEMGAAGRTLLAFFIGAITACSSALTSSPPKSYVPWEPLPPAQHYVTTPLASPVSPPAVPEGAAVCRGAQLEGVALAEGAATGNVNMPLLFRNRSTTDCFLEGYSSVSVLNADGRPLAISTGEKSQGTFFADDPVTRVMLLHGTPALPKPFARSNGSLGQAFMNFSWYDCREPRASRLAIDLPNGGGWFWMPFRISADASPACHGSSDDYTVTERGPFSAAGLSWAPSLDFISAEVNIVAPRSAARGAEVRYFITIRNGSTRDYDMLPCADYSESLVKERLATYQLNCASVARIAPGGMATFEMRARIPRALATGPSEVVWCLSDGRLGIACGTAAIDIT